jgi:hypothetical protein
MWPPCDEVRRGAVMRDHEHPHPDLLHRFLRGEASKSENGAVVRHLLSGCRECLAVTRPVWQAVDRLARRKRKAKPKRPARSSEQARPAGRAYRDAHPGA